MRTDGFYTDQKGKITGIVIRDGRQINAIKVFVDHYNVQRDPVTGWATLRLREISDEAGMNPDWAGTQISIWRRVQPHPWIERKGLARTNEVELRITPAGAKVFGRHGAWVDLPSPLAAPKFPEPPAPVDAPTVVATSLLQQLCDEIEDLLTRPSSGVVTCDHEAELAELDALRQWRDTVLATKP